MKKAIKLILLLVLVLALIAIVATVEMLIGLPVTYAVIPNIVIGGTLGCFVALKGINILEK